LIQARVGAEQIKVCRRSVFQRTKERAKRIACGQKVVKARKQHRSPGERSPERAN